MRPKVSMLGISSVLVKQWPVTCKRNLPLGWSEWKNCELCRLIKGRMKLPYSLEPVNVIGDNKRKRVKKVNINIFVKWETFVYTEGTAGADLKNKSFFQIFAALRAAMGQWTIADGHVWGRMLWKGYCFGIAPLILPNIAEVPAKTRVVLYGLAHT